MKRILLFIFIISIVLMAARVSVVKWSQISDVNTTLDEINRIHGLSSSVQDQLNGKVDTVDSIDPDDFFNDYTKNNSIALVDSILNARFGNLQLVGSKLSYTAFGNKYIAQTDSVENLGTELVANGVFASGTGWDNYYSRFTITGGVAQVNTVSTTYAPFLYQDIVITNGTTYRVQVSVTAYTSGNFVIGLNDKGDGVQSAIINGTGNYTFYLTSNMDEPKQVILQSWDFPFVGSIDNISVKEVL